MRGEALLERIVNPALCSVCPRRNLINRQIAQTVLGSDYAAPHCNPVNIVSDSALKNELFDLGLVDKPVGLRATPELQEKVNEGVAASSPQALHIPVEVRFGLGDQICPQDLPANPV